MDGENISLVTYKKNGGSIATQVWFVEEAKKIYIVTIQGRYKLKRITNNPYVKITPASMQGKPSGEYVEGIARILSDDEVKPIIVLFEKKYRMFKQLFKGDREGEKKLFVIEITLN
ncbi:MAG: pyridoxamine 5'-phosphate oxidase family protein [Promethearchaeota archaeon]|jgi:PPOX class probable F420-dependent enzyme